MLLLKGHARYIILELKGILTEQRQAPMAELQNFSVCDSIKVTHIYRFTGNSVLLQRYGFQFIG